MFIIFSLLAVTTCYKALCDFLRIFIKKLFDILKTFKMFLKIHISACSNLRRLVTKIFINQISRFLAVSFRDITLYVVNSHLIARKFIKMLYRYLMNYYAGSS